MISTSTNTLQLHMKTDGNESFPLELTHSLYEKNMKTEYMKYISYIYVIYEN